MRNRHTGGTRQGRGPVRRSPGRASRFRLGAVMLTLIACSPSTDRVGDGAAGAPGEESPARNNEPADALPRDVRVTPLAFARDVDENSAAAASVAHPGLVFTINDSGNDPELFAFDTTGGDRGRWRIEGAMNRDWEAVAVGRCGPEHDAWCVYIGDVGDNARRRPLVTIYRVAEPAPLAAGERGSLRADVLIARYPDGAHNVEGMVIAPDGAVQLVTKELRRSGGRGPATTLVYELPARAWGGATPAEAVLVDSLPMPPDAVARTAVTDAAMTPDGTLLVVRTYARVLAYRLDSATARPLPGRPPARCDLAALDEAQGEGVGILHQDERAVRLVLTSEGGHEPLRLATCPIPSR